MKVTPTTTSFPGTRSPGSGERISDSGLVAIVCAESDLDSNAKAASASVSTDTAKTALIAFMSVPPSEQRSGFGLRQYHREHALASGRVHHRDLDLDGLLDRLRLRGVLDQCLALNRRNVTRLCFPGNRGCVRSQNHDG